MTMNSVKEEATESRRELKAIGFVSNRVTEPVDDNWGSVVSRLNLRKEYSKGITGLGQFSHALVLTFLNRSRFKKATDLVRRPRGLDSMPEVGIFAQRAKDRPNSIGVTAVEIISVGDGFVDVKGLDAINGTPILDIKPYYPQYDLIKDARVPEWVDTLMQNYF